MNIRILEEFITLAGCLNFSETAAVHFIAQPALSKHIANLESELGVVLFRRNKHDVELTEYGERFLPDAKQIVYLYQKNLSELRYAFSDKRGELRISYLDAAARNILPNIARSFHERFPLVDLNLVNDSPQGIMERLSSGRCDLAITIQSKLLSGPGFESQVLYNDPICAVVPREHRLAQQGVAHLSDLNGETLLRSTESAFNEYGQFLQNMVEEAGVSIEYSQQRTTTEASLILIELGKGIALRPSHQCLILSPGLVAIPFVDKQASYNVVLAWKTNNQNPLLKEMIVEFTKGI